MLSLRAPSLVLQTVLQALGKPGYASGTLELRADLRGAGDTPHAIAASLDGPIGVAVPKGEIDSKLLGGMMSQLVQQTELNKLANVAGMSALNCFALRIDASNGVGTVRALRLDTSTVSMDGSGTVNFGTETLDLHLKPMIGIAGTDIATPVIVRGSIVNPSIEPDAVGTVTGNAGNAAKLALGASTGGLALIIGSALEQKFSGDGCAAPLALARLESSPGGSSGGASTPSASSAPPAGQSGSAAGQSPSKPANPFGALKKLFQ
jgi:AsmA protein